MNKIILIGRLTKDPELRYTSTGKPLCNFTLAVNREFAKEEEQNADFINCQIWGKSAENLAKYLKKGSQCAVEGRIQVRTYEDRDGTTRWITEVVVRQIEFVGDKKAAETNVEEFGTEVEYSDSDLPW